MRMRLGFRRGNVLRLLDCCWALIRLIGFFGMPSSDMLCAIPDIGKGHTAKVAFIHLDLFMDNEHVLREMIALSESRVATFAFERTGLLVHSPRMLLEPRPVLERALAPREFAFVGPVTEMNLVDVPVAVLLKEKRGRTFVTRKRTTSPL